MESPKRLHYCSLKPLSQILDLGGNCCNDKRTSLQLFTAVKSRRVCATVVYFKRLFNSSMIKIQNDTDSPRQAFLAESNILPKTD